MELSDNHRPSKPRETMLTLVLTGLAAGGILTFLMLITGGLFFYVILAVAVMTGLGFFHYVLWGHSMTLDVEEEQAQAAAEQRAELDREIHAQRLPRRF